MHYLQQTRSFANRFYCPFEVAFRIYPGILKSYFWCGRASVATQHLKRAQSRYPAIGKRQKQSTRRRERLHKPVLPKTPCALVSQFPIAPNCSNILPQAFYGILIMNCHSCHAMSETSCNAAVLVVRCRQRFRQSLSGRLVAGGLPPSINSYIACLNRAWFGIAQVECDTASHCDTDILPAKFMMFSGIAQRFEFRERLSF